MTAEVPMRLPIVMIARLHTQAPDSITTGFVTNAMSVLNA
jgi:hypothetical protein